MPSFDKWGSMDFKMELREKNHIFSLWNIRAGDFDNTLPVNFDEEPFIYQASNVKKKFDKFAALKSEYFSHYNLAKTLPFFVINQ